MTDEEKQILDDLMFKGQAFTKASLYDGKIAVEIKNLSVQNQLDIEASMKDVEGVPAYLMHTYALKMLSQTITRYGDKVFSSPEETLEFLSTLPSVVLDVIIAKQSEFEKKIKALMSPESIEENFSETGSTETESS